MTANSTPAIDETSQEYLIAFNRGKLAGLRAAHSICANYAFAIDNGGNQYIRYPAAEHCSRAIYNLVVRASGLSDT